jgi:hypothetical protein
MKETKATSKGALMSIASPIIPPAAKVISVRSHD